MTVAVGVAVAVEVGGGVGEPIAGIAPQPPSNDKSRMPQNSTAIDWKPREDFRFADIIEVAATSDACVLYAHTMNLDLDLFQSDGIR